MSATRRPTIVDIATKLGMAKSTVSNALNGRPGVSEATRAAVLDAASQLQWRPSGAARALSRSRTNVVGFLLARPATLLGAEAFFMQLIAGIESRLSRDTVNLLFSTVSSVDDEVETLERWAGERLVDGVFLTDLRETDPRLERVQELGLPSVAFGLSTPSPGVSGVFCDEAGSIREAVRYLAALGHRHIARVAGRPDFRNTTLRSKAFLEETADLGLRGDVLTANEYSAPEGAQITRQLLSQRERPTAVIYENEVMAVMGSSVAQEMGLQVPQDLSIVAIGDFPICSLVTPKLTAVGRDVPEFGEAGADALLRLLDGGAPELVQTVTPRLEPRASTAAPPRTA
ncbi:LacI family DNA-binding transcriptional regulator [Leifsonia sp. ZF2019]|uniref:LacI family DNA-binding transcriptional regulator n=1 Tax=Leifsonia sp. ZF2019 TaxID=2781978 RepID=UPI001CBCB8C2|nr:LacI family DNA-binding transcriptional regulator [Leifsonia sp. ZF2019]UAJ79514.1 LacI family DNA-binding transcriptional regulator [Leifsonia sp. ZF2019]